MTARLLFTVRECVAGPAGWRGERGVKLGTTRQTVNKDECGGRETAKPELMVTFTFRHT